MKFDIGEKTTAIIMPLIDEVYLSNTMFGGESITLKGVKRLKELLNEQENNTKNN